MLRARLGAAVLAALLLCSAAGAQSRRGELRGVWIGGDYGRDWPAIARSLREAGLNAVFPNLCTAGAAFYPSHILPQVEGEARDELAEAARAAREFGLELHVWHTAWALLHCPPDLLARYGAEGRLMRSHEGRLAREDPDLDPPVDWLCPSHPENRRLEKEAALELVRRYDIAGLHFDELRYPSSDYCFCDHCRARFEADAGAPVANWPEDVHTGPLADQYRDWRRGLQTSLLTEISKEAREVRPQILVSVSAWPEAEVARAHALQDWPRWVEGGALDFVCFLNYTLDPSQLAAWLTDQVDLVGGAVPIYAGLGAFLMASAQELIAQVRAARDAGADGFVAFAYDREDLPAWLPALRATVAAADPHPTPHGSPPARMSFGGEAASPPASGRRLVARAPFEVELFIGYEPPPPSDEDSAAGAAQAAAILRRTIETRSPVATYGAPEGLALPTGAGPRLSGRILVEDPSGLTLRPLGAFGGEYGVGRRLRFPAPEGPFRIAIYGEFAAPERPPHEFVVRSPLLLGLPEEQLPAAPPAPKAELDRLWEDVCGQLSLQELADERLTLLVRAGDQPDAAWWLRLDRGQCQSGLGQVESPDLVFEASLADLVAIARREANPRALWETGRLRALGDHRLLSRIARLLDRHWGLAP